MVVAAPERALRAPGAGRPATAQPPHPATGSGRPGSHRSLRPTAAVCIIVVVASMLMVVGADAYLTQGQVRLTRIQSTLTSEATTYRDLELRVAQLANPNRIVSQAEGDGLGPPSNATDLPTVTAPPSATSTSSRSHPPSQSPAGR